MALLSSSLNFSCLSDFLHGKFFPESIIVLEQPYLKSFDTTLCEMDSEAFFTSLFLSFKDGFALGCFKPLHSFTICSAFPGFGLLPLGVSFPLDQVQV